ncbi:hypothetical protein WJX72_006131 [[Myrmecia] bisecta]|uniref:Glutamate-5-semialdehyde dehydrogenase n=1 Tax=[Myrmecia] bisecta TaxID=41462 RepID=A0AAW1QQX4_9CHLO
MPAPRSSAFQTAAPFAQNGFHKQSGFAPLTSQESGLSSMDRSLESSLQSTSSSKSASSDRRVSFKHLKSPDQSPRAAQPNGKTSPTRSFSQSMAEVTACVSFSDLAKNFEKDVEEAYGSHDPSREQVRNARRVVIKVGTAVVTRSADHRLSLGRLGALVEQIEALVRSGRECILVTSGGVSVGRQRLRQQQVLNSSPLEMQIQGPSAVSSRAAAAAGQSGLMALYDSLFSMMDLQAAQVLVTSNDFMEPTFKANLCATVEDLLRMNVVPVFNENDAISKGAVKNKDNAPEEVAFWDNDSLAALLAIELKADLLMLLTDVNGLYTGPPTEPTSKIIHTYCPQIHDQLIRFGSASNGGRGGMTAKVDAAWLAADHGVTTVIASGKGGDSIMQVVAGQLVGTLFGKEDARRVLLEHEHAKHISAGTAAAQGLEVPSDSPAAFRKQAMDARQASRVLQSLSSKEREQILYKIAKALEAAEEEIMAANAADVHAAEGRIDANVMQRLALKPQKIKQLGAGIRAIAAQEEPIRKVLSRLEVANGLTLEKVTAPIGVLLIIFEARPDALPQIAALAIRSGNGLLLKGGKEASRSNATLHRIIVDAIAAAAPQVGPELISLITSRAAVDELLKLDDVIDLVIPRGSNALVSHIQQHTKIAVLGHADGICHIYLDPAVDIARACRVCVDAKTDYPAACNAVEKILVHSDLARDGRLFQLQFALRDAGVSLLGGQRASHILGLPAAPSDRHEYGTAALTMELVDSMDEAIDHIHAHGSGHTECILTEDPVAAEAFLRRVDSACVNHNASTRFSDGFRFGLGAEVGISTSRIHARGPVGVEGLLTTRWLLRGHGHTVEKDAHIKYTHKALPIGGAAKSLAAAAAEE